MSNSTSSPRQKMINMMYLVLTALLALNVSAEVLKAFKLVNESIAQSNQTLEKNNLFLLQKFDQRLQNNPLKVAPIQTKALLAKKIGSSTYDYLEALKQSIIKEAGGYDKETGMLKNADDINISTRYFVEDNGKNGKALRKNLEDSRKALLQIIGNANEQKELSQILVLDAKSTENNTSWEFNQFNHLPAVAAITVLSKYQNDIKNMESKILESLYKSIDEGDYKVDAMKACVLAPSNRLLQGDQYEASILVAAYSSTQSPNIYLGSFNQSVKKLPDGSFAKIENASAAPLLHAQKVDVNNGIGKINMAANSIGEQKYSGVVEVKNPNGNGFDYYPFEGKFNVAPKLSSISPSYMNVFYVGVDNPVDIAVSATGSDMLASINMGTLRKLSNGKYMANFSSAGKAVIAVKAKVGDKVFDMGSQTFKVKNLPSPVITLNGAYYAGPIPIKNIINTTGIVAKMPDDFEYVVKPTVLSFSVLIFKKNGTIVQENCSGPAYSNRVLNVIRHLDKDDQVHLENVTVLLPGNVKKNIGNASYIAKS